MNSIAADQVRAGASLAAGEGFWSGLRFGVGGAMTGLAFAAFDSANQRRGEKLPTLAGRTMGLGTYPLMAGAFASGLMLIPGMQPIAAGLAGALAASYPNGMFQNSLARGFRRLTEAGRSLYRLEMGGRYIDSHAAAAHRVAAVQEMNASLVASRRWLGQEALFYHR